MFYHQKIRQLREEKGMSTRDLGRLVHISASSISRYERGLRNPHIHTKMKFAWIFRKDLNWFYEEPKKLWERG